MPHQEFHDRDLTLERMEHEKQLERAQAQLHEAQEQQRLRRLGYYWATPAGTEAAETGATEAQAQRTPYFPLVPQHSAHGDGEEKASNDNEDEEEEDDGDAQRASSEALLRLLLLSQPHGSGAGADE